jgi:hypothetical protein
VSLKSKPAKPAKFSNDLPNKPDISRMEKRALSCQPWRLAMMRYPRRLRQKINRAAIEVKATAVVVAT